MGSIFSTTSPLKTKETEFGRERSSSPVDHIQHQSIVNMTSTQADVPTKMLINPLSKDSYVPLGLLECLDRTYKNVTLTSSCRGADKCLKLRPTHTLLREMYALQYLQRCNPEHVFYSQVCFETFPGRQYSIMVSPYLQTQHTFGDAWKTIIEQYVECFLTNRIQHNDLTYANVGLLLSTPVDSSHYVIFDFELCTFPGQVYDVPIAGGYFRGLPPSLGKDVLDLFLTSCYCRSKQLDFDIGTLDDTFTQVLQEFQLYPQLCEHLKEGVLCAFTQPLQQQPHVKNINQEPDYIYEALQLNRTIESSFKAAIITLCKKLV